MPSRSQVRVYLIPARPGDLNFAKSVRDAMTANRAAGASWNWLVPDSNPAAIVAGPCTPTGCPPTLRSDPAEPVRPRRPHGRTHRGVITWPPVYWLFVFEGGVIGSGLRREEHAEAVVLDVREASGDAAVELDEAVDRLGAAVGGAGVEVGQERVLPLAQGPAQPGEVPRFSAAFMWAAARG